MTTIFNLSIAAKATLNLHSLNNEGGEGNQTQTRIVNIVSHDGRLHSVNAISGDMLKHIQAEHLYRISKERGLPPVRRLPDLRRQPHVGRSRIPSVGVAEGETHSGAGRRQIAYLYAGRH